MANSPEMSTSASLLLSLEVLDPSAATESAGCFRVTGCFRSILLEPRDGDFLLDFGLRPFADGLLLASLEFFSAGLFLTEAARLFVNPLASGFALSLLTSGAVSVTTSLAFDLGLDVRRNGFGETGADVDVSR